MSASRCAAPGVAPAHQGARAPGGGRRAAACPYTESPGATPARGFCGYDSSSFCPACRAPIVAAGSRGIRACGEWQRRAVPDRPCVPIRRCCHGRWHTGASRLPAPRSGRLIRTRSNGGHHLVCGRAADAPAYTARPR